VQEKEQKKMPKGGSGKVQQQGLTAGKPAAALKTPELKNILPGTPRDTEISSGPPAEGSGGSSGGVGEPKILGDSAAPKHAQVGESEEIRFSEVMRLEARSMLPETAHVKVTQPKFSPMEGSLHALILVALAAMVAAGDMPKNAPLLSQISTVASALFTAICIQAIMYCLYVTALLYKALDDGYDLADFGFGG